MQMSAAAVIEAGAISMGGEQGADGIALVKLQLPVAEASFKLALLGNQRVALARLDRDVHLAPVQIAFDSMPRHSVLEPGQRFDRDIPQLARVVDAEQLDEFVLPARVAADCLAAAAS